MKKKLEKGQKEASGAGRKAEPFFLKIVEEGKECKEKGELE